MGISDSTTTTIKVGRVSYSSIPQCTVLFYTFAQLDDRILQPHL